MSISEDLNGPDKFYFWFQPSTNAAAKKEILIWLNGGVCLRDLAPGFYLR